MQRKTAMQHDCPGAFNAAARESMLEELAGAGIRPCSCTGRKCCNLAHRVRLGDVFDVYLFSSLASRGGG